MDERSVETGGRAALVKLQALGESQDERALPTLVAALAASSPRVRNIAAVSLGLYGKPPAHEPLIAAIAGADPELRAIIAESLGKVGSAEAVEPLVGLLSDANSRVRLYALHALGDIRTGVPIEPVVERLEDKDWLVRIAAAQTLADLRATEALPRVTALRRAERFRPLAWRMLRRIERQLAAARGTP